MKIPLLANLNVYSVFILLAARYFDAKSYTVLELRIDNKVTLVYVDFTKSSLLFKS